MKTWLFTSLGKFWVFFPLLFSHVSNVFTAGELSCLQYRHPLDKSQTLPFLAAEFVTADKGTGLVHIAPAHGPDDFKLARKHSLSVVSNFCSTLLCLVISWILVRHWSGQVRLEYFQIGFKFSLVSNFWMFNYQLNLVYSSKSIFSNTQQHLSILQGFSWIS